ncbi:MAG: DUF2332 domain-containing protein [Candidatus Dormibacteraceae bacterium]
MPEPREILAKRLRFQAAGCGELGSPFYAAILEAAASDLDQEGAVWGVLAGLEVESGWSAVALRMMAAVHRFVLSGELAELAEHYPSTGGDGDATAAWPLFRQVLLDRADDVRRLVSRGCQTNEVGRSAALLGGFLEIADRAGLPLRILEIGASAGLNLRWDMYRYESEDREGWGDPSSGVRFIKPFDVPPPLDRNAEVVERKGCDLEPVDPTSDEGTLTLRSFVWADQLGRLSLLDGAIELAKKVPVEVERADAARFLERELARPVPGTATIVYHSVFIQYVDEPGRARIAAAIDAAQARAAADAPVFHLGMEPGAGTFEIRLDGKLLGTSRAHGTGVRWLVG